MQNKQLLLCRVFAVTGLIAEDDRRKRQLLSWVKSMLPWIGEEDLFDFTASWQDGIVLCALVETLSPGACPRFNLLKPHHRVNNCRLGITLAQKYLQVAQVPLSPEEMAIADEGCEVKICHLVQLLKWKYQKQGSKPTPFSSASVEEPAPCKCYARGTGLRAGIYNKERIVSMYASSISRYGNNVISASASALSEDDGRTKVIEDGAGHSFIRQRCLDEDTGHLVIPFDYQCVGEGRFLVSYIPRSAGTHRITVLQQDAHVQGSPFEVKVRKVDFQRTRFLVVSDWVSGGSSGKAIYYQIRGLRFESQSGSSQFAIAPLCPSNTKWVSDWVSSWNLVIKPRVVPLDMLQTIEEKPKDSLKPSSAAPEKLRVRIHLFLDATYLNS
ncbi:filamin-c [Plakobranchus ocellatus]|uniref:Filamin-c n=1 Tax=Plakobranchus ocellatus TaxID=259542 RepID=A0AAV4C1M7_9GAST|nr:filamin-c [Plakobranchus ocellatus]